MDGRATDQQLQGSQGQAWNQASAEHLRLRSNGVTAGAAPSDRYSSDPEKAFVMRAGEVFHLGEQAITRIA